MKLKLGLGLGAVAALLITLAGWGCSGDSCTELYDKLTKCNFGTTASSSSGGTDDGPACNDDNAVKAQCVLDANIDVCKKDTDPNVKKTYDDCQTKTSAPQ